MLQLITIQEEFHNMAHIESKRQWESLTQKEKENLWLQVHGSRNVPAQVSGYELDHLFKGKNNVNYEKDKSDSLGGGIPD